MKAKGGRLRAELLARDTFLERVAQGLDRRVAALERALARARLAAPARKALEDVTGFVRELGLIARPDATVQPNGEVTDLAASIRAILEAHADKLGRARKVQLAIDGPVRVACAAGDVETVLMELLSNTAKYGKGTIGVAVETTRSHARLVIRDDGPGIAPADRLRAVAKFARGPGARLRKGFGVGLWLVQKISRGYGGDLRIRDGAVFEVTLPLAAPAKRRRPAASGVSSNR